MLLQLQESGVQRALIDGELVAAFDRDLLPSLRLINLEDGEVRPQKAVSQSLASLAAILAVLAVTLAAVGIYGVIAYRTW
jgi:hypothetical protein